MGVVQHIDKAHSWSSAPLACGGKESCDARPTYLCIRLGLLGKWVNRFGRVDVNIRTSVYAQDLVGENGTKLASFNTFTSFPVS